MKKVLALCLCIVMIISISPLSVFALDSNENVVKSIQVIGEPIELLEETDGYWRSNGKGGSYFWYWTDSNHNCSIEEVEPIRNDYYEKLKNVQLKVSFNDDRADETKSIYDWLNDAEFGKDVYIKADQASHYYAGNIYTGYVYFCDAKTPIEFEVVHDWRTGVRMAPEILSDRWEVKDCNICGKEEETPLNIPTEEIKVGEVKSVAYENWYDCVRYEFVPTETAYYVFDARNDDIGNLEVDIANEEGIIIGKGCCELEADKKYICQVDNDEYYKGIFDICVNKATKAQSIEVSFSNGLTYSKLFLSPDGYDVDVAFYPIFAKPEAYTVTSGDDSVIEVDKEENRIYVKSVGTVKLTIETDGGIKKEIEVTTYDYDTLSLDEEKSITFPSTQYADDLEKYLNFIPQESGYYTFYSNGIDNIVRAFLFDCDTGEELDYDEYGNTGFDFKVSAYLEAGKKYQLFFFMPMERKDDNTFTVTVKKSVEPQSINLCLPHQNPINLKNSLQLKVRFLPEASYEEDYTVTVSNKDVLSDSFSMQSYEFFSALNTGMTIVTVKTSSGLEASLPVYIKGETFDYDAVFGNNISLDINSTAKLSNDGILSDIKPIANTVGETLKQISNEEVIIINKNGDKLDLNDKVGTGSRIVLYNGDEATDEVVAVVTGDFNGDGDMDNKDVVLSMQNILEIIPADEYQSVAIDVTGDGIVNNRDCAKMAQYLVGKVEL